MSVDQKDIVDAVSRSRETGDVSLTISDHLDWSAPLEHLLALQEKINSYLSFIQSGQILEAYPDARDKKIIIQVFFRCPPPDGEVARFLATAKERVEEAGFLFRYVVKEEEPNQPVQRNASTGSVSNLKSPARRG